MLAAAAAAVQARRWVWPPSAATASAGARSVTAVPQHSVGRQGEQQITHAIDSPLRLWPDARQGRRRRLSLAAVTLPRLSPADMPTKMRPPTVLVTLKLALVMKMRV